MSIAGGDSRPSFESGASTLVAAPSTERTYPVHVAAADTSSSSSSTAAASAPVVRAPADNSYLERVSAGGRKISHGIGGAGNMSMSSMICI